MFNLKNNVSNFDFKVFYKAIGIFRNKIFKIRFLYY